MGRSVPSRAMRTVELASPTIVPSRRARRAGFSAGSRVSSLTMWKTSGSGRPCASAWGQPVRASATAFMNVTRPSASVLITASPMLASVTRSHSDCFRSASSARWRASTMLRAFCSATARSRSSSSSRSAITRPREFPPRARCPARAPDLGKGRLPARRRVVAERGEPAVVAGPELLDRDVLAPPPARGRGPPRASRRAGRSG